MPGAGKGLRTTTKVKKNTILLSYMGVIKPHYEVLHDNNDIFSLGVLKTKDETALLIDPSEVSNAARLINTTYGKHINCRAELGTFKPRAYHHNYGHKRHGARNEAIL